MKVKTTYGYVQGERFYGGFRFLGIPYAKAPVGRLRFLPPVPPDPWDGVRLCNVWPKTPLQIPYQAQVQSEDSLALNIWVPETEQSSHMPVMVWIHGGSYATGSTTNCSANGDNELYDAKTLARETGCIIVTVNYRLNVMGFLDLSQIDPAFTRNNGIRDVVAALAWIRDNIEGFGGDKDNVTVFGQSAGGGITLALLCIPQAKELFHKVICQSSGDSGFYSRLQGEELAFDWLAAMGQPSLDDLISMPPERLLSCVKEMNEKKLSQRLDCTFCPIIDGEFLIGKPSQMDMQHLNKHLMIGWNHDEANLFMLMVPKDKFKKTDSLPLILPDQSETTRAKIIHATSGFPNKKTYCQLATERMYSIPITQVANQVSKHNPVYVYRFDYAPILFHLAGANVCHIMELPLLWGNAIKLGRRKLPIGNPEIGRKLRKMWGDFAHTGVPSPLWEQYQAVTQPIYAIGKKDYMEYGPVQDRVMLYEG